MPPSDDAEDSGESRDRLGYFGSPAGLDRYVTVKMRFEQDHLRVGKILPARFPGSLVPFYAFLHAFFADGSRPVKSARRRATDARRHAE